MSFADRRDAGRRLARLLGQLDLTDPVVLALPRGGVPVAFEVATALGAPLDVIVARKIGAPGQPELGVGALAEGGVVYLDEAALRALGLSHRNLEATIAREQAELHRRVERYRGGRAPHPLEGRCVIVVDDGLATGGTARAALRSVRSRQPLTVVLAAPVGPPEARDFLVPDADEVVLGEAPRRLASVGQWYVDFTQTGDAEVVALLEAARGREARGD